MAKQSTILIKLVSTADTGYYYVTKKNPRTSTEKLSFKKYDPVARKHVHFRSGRKPPLAGRLFVFRRGSVTLSSACHPYVAHRR